MILRLFFLLFNFLWMITIQVHWILTSLWHAADVLSYLILAVVYSSVHVCCDCETVIWHYCGERYSFIWDKYLQCRYFIMKLYCRLEHGMSHVICKCDSKVTWRSIVLKVTLLVFLVYGFCPCSNYFVGMFLMFLL